LDNKQGLALARRSLSIQFGNFSQLFSRLLFILDSTEAILTITSTQSQAQFDFGSVADYTRKRTTFESG
jgi:hypothetical protein